MEELMSYVVVFGQMDQMADDWRWTRMRMEDSGMKVGWKMGSLMEDE